MTEEYWKPHNTDLYKATLQFVEATIKLLNDVSKVPNLSFDYQKICEFKKIGPDKRIVTRYEPRFLLLNDARDLISNLNETKVCSEIIRADHEIELAPFYRETNKIEWYLLPFFVSDLISNDLEFSQIHTNFDVAFRKLESFLYCKAYEYRLVAILEAFTSSVPSVRLSPETTIQRIDDEYCLAMAQTAAGKDEFYPGYLQEHPYALIIDTEKPKVPNGSNQRLSDENATVQNIISALRLLRVSRVHINAVFNLLITWQPGCANAFSRKQSIHNFLPDFHLDKDDVPQLFALWKEIEEGSPQVTRLRIALDRYESTFETKDTAEQLIDAVIAFESLYVQGGSGLSHKLALRAATVLGRDGKHREQLYRFLKSAYDKRSALVHGSISGVDFENWLGAMDSYGAQFINPLREDLRKSLRKFLVFFTQHPELATASAGNREKLDRFLTSCVLGNARFEEEQAE